MREDFSVRFLYNTKAGRMLLKLLTKPIISKLGGAILDSAFSRVLIPEFIRKNSISLEGIEVPAKGFYSFNDFFKRRKKVIEIDDRENHFINPCDGLLSVVKLDKESFFRIKNTRYNLESLLKDRELSKEFEGGYALIYRLTPKHYHRYIFVDDAMIKSTRCISGKLHCVRPVALCKYPVFTENTREYTVLETENFGKMIQMEVGAIMVGKISNHKLTGRVLRGMEKGCFEFGGSTIVVIVQKDSICFDRQTITKLKKMKEIPVYLGRSLAVKMDEKLR
ncbi:MAG: phosphatidylserine decarboxylase [Catonella sp.]|uniref:phosphatidylserine decarboxylase n=1 Tax=Catonella sp. TaxID=2382125 RepID=UPI003F9FDD7C